MIRQYTIISFLVSICFLSAHENNQSKHQQHGYRKHYEISEPNWAHKFPRINDTPVIGVLTLPILNELKKDNYTRYFQANYVKYLEAPGARVVPVYHDLPTDQLQELLSKLNGVLLTGGGAQMVKQGTQFTLTDYGRSVDTIVKFSRSELQNGRYFSVWGTCLGFEALHVIQARSINALGNSAAQHINLTLHFQKNYRESEMYRHFDPALIRDLQTVPLTFNSHHNGIPLQKYQEKELGLEKIFNILTTSFDPKGQQIVTSVSGKQLPIYAVQFHPQKSQYDHYEGVNIPHDIRAIETSMNLANFFVFETRRSPLRMSFDEAIKRMVQNDYLEVTKFYIGQVYLF